jgi:hypothetical protein
MDRRTLQLDGCVFGDGRAASGSIACENDVRELRSVQSGHRDAHPIAD